MKKCLGCGVVLQNTDKDALGYTPKLENDLCIRCYKLKHYGNLINSGKHQDNAKLLKEIDKKNGHVLFLIDFLNIYNDVMETYKKIKCSKTLVVTKSDLIPKNIKKEKLVKNIKDIYDIKEDVLLVSSKTKENLNAIEKICLNNSTIVFAGFTNAGKSSIINALVGSDITVSRNINTTQEFIKLKIDGIDIYDAPGFINSKVYDNVAKSKIKPKTYQLANKYYLNILDINIASVVDINLTLYFDNFITVSKRRIKDNLEYNLEIPANNDLVIKGLGFIKFSGSTKVSVNIDRDYLDIRPTIIGGNYEQD